MDKFEEILPKLMKLQLFAEFNPEDLEDRRIIEAVTEKLSVKKFSKGDVIIREGDEGDDFFILAEGSVQVLRKTPAGDTICLANLEAGQNIFFGEAALVGRDKRTATVKAVSDVTAFVLSGNEFHHLCDKEPVLGYRVVLCIAKRMSRTIQETNNDKAALYEALCNEIEFG